MKHLDDMDRYCRGAVCRHRALVQSTSARSIGSRTSCRRLRHVPGRTAEAAVADALGRGPEDPVVRGPGQGALRHRPRHQRPARREHREHPQRCGHDKLSTYGLLKEHGKADVRDWIYQLIGQGVLAQEDVPGQRKRESSRSFGSTRFLGSDEGPACGLAQGPVHGKGGNPGEIAGRHGLLGRGGPRAVRDPRQLRRQVAAERGVPPYFIFSDATLRELAQGSASTWRKCGWSTASAKPGCKPSAHEFFR